MSSILGSVLGGLGGGEIGRASVGLVLNTAQYEEGLAKTEAQTKAASAAMAASFAVVGAAAVAFAAASVKAAIEQKEAQDKLANSIANSTKVSFSSVDAFDKQASSLSLLTGEQDDNITSSQSMLVQMGANQEQVLALTPLIGDLAAKQGVDLLTATKAVGKSINGTTGGLSRMGVVVDKNAAKTDAYGATLKALGVVAGFAEQRADAEPWRKLNAQFHELQETVGKGLLPVLVQFTGILASLSQKHLPDMTSVVHLLDVALGAATGSWELFHAGLAQGATDTGDLQTEINAVNDALAAGNITSGDAVLKVRALAEAHGMDGDSVNALSTAEEAYTDKLTKANAATALAATSVHHFADMTKSDLTDWKTSVTGSIESTFNVLGVKTKDIFNVTEAQLDKDFSTMLKNALRFKTDLAELLTLKPGTLGLSPVDTQKFEIWMGKQAPGYIDAFVNASKAKQREWVAEWLRNTNAVNSAIDGVGRHIKDLPNKVITISIGGAVGGSVGRHIGGRVNVPLTESPSGHG